MPDEAFETRKADEEVDVRKSTSLNREKKEKAF